jgi:acyl carrier protein phosphodiesterase
VQRHQAIDAFTDAHPLVRRSRARMGAEHRRFSAVLVDVFYDHFMATRWEQYSAEPLNAFTAAFYADVRACEIALPEAAQTMVDRIIRHDLLGGYSRIEGVEMSLRRLSMRLAARWHRPFELERSVSCLLADEAGFAADFAGFFPELQAHVRQWSESSAAAQADTAATLPGSR